VEYRRAFLQALFLFCEERNIDAQKIAKLSDISLSDLNTKPTYEITNLNLEKVWKNIVHLSKDDLVGLHFGATMQLAALNIVGQIIQTTNNVKEALRQACSFIHLLTDFYTMHLEEKTKTFTITFQKNNVFGNFTTAQNQMGDFLVAFTLYELRGLLLESPKPIKASFPTFKKNHEREYEVILRCPIEKGDFHFLEFEKDYLKTKIITANYEIQSLLIRYISNLQSPTFLNGVLSKQIFNFLIANSYFYSLSMESVARNFSVSVRTLQRKLKEEGVSYLQIVEEVRKSLAINYIENSSSSIKEISKILGYAEPSGLVRAFKKWTKKTPLEYRNNKN